MQISFKASSKYLFKYFHIYLNLPNSLGLNYFGFDRINMFNDSFFYQRSVERNRIFVRTKWFITSNL